MPDVTEESRQLIAAAAYDEAERRLALALKAHASHPEANALMGILYCLTQREDRAVPHLRLSGDSSDGLRLAQMIVDYLHCRKLMMERIGVKDAIGPRMLRAVREVTDLAASPDIGITLSACLIVRNEEKHLERCLNSIQGLVDEIALVDTGSTDRTLEIAEAFGAKVGHFEWCDDFAAARNESLKLATGHWALWIDADEELAKEGWNTLREGLVRPQFGGYSITIVNFMCDGSRAEQYVHTPVRLFRRLPGVHFVSRIHEQVMPSIAELGLPFATLGAARIYHYGYTGVDMVAKDKLNRAITMIEREVRDYPDDSFHWFNLTNAFAVGERHQDVVRSAKTTLRLLAPDSPYGSLVYHLLIGSLLALSQTSEALIKYHEALQRGYSDILVEFQNAQTLLAMGRFDDALASADHCLSLPWPANATGDYGIFTHKTHTLKGRILLQLGRFDEAFLLFEHALSVAPRFAFALQGKGLALEAMGKLDEALAAFETAFDLETAGPQARKNAARILVKLGRWCEAAAILEAVWRANPSDHDAWIGWVQACEQSGDVACVVRAYAAYAEGRELSVEMLIGWGRALASVGDGEKAMDCLAEAIRREPSCANAYFNAGDLLYGLGHYADAAHLYECGLRHQPENPQAWFVLGNSLAQLGLLDGAESSYLQALRIQPEHLEAKANLEVVAEALQIAA